MNRSGKQISDGGKRMKMQFGLPTLFTIIIIASLLAAIFVWTRTGLPQGWDKFEIADGAVKDTTEILDCDILAWKIIQDDRPLVIHDCLIWTKLKLEDGTIEYRVSNVYRHPDLRNEWELASYDGEWGPLWDKSWNRPPSSAEILEFIDRSDWKWTPSSAKTRSGKVLDSFQYIDGRVQQRIWKRRTGDWFDEKIPAEYLY